MIKMKIVHKIFLKQNHHINHLKTNKLFNQSTWNQMMQVKPLLRADIERSDFKNKKINLIMKLIGKKAHFPQPKSLYQTPWTYHKNTNYQKSQYKV